MKLSRSDVAVVAMVLLGTVALAWLFVSDISGIAIRADQRPLGTVTFKKLTATRKAGDGFSWERMRNNDPVYQDDTLRTANLSEASINFDDGTSLDLLENTMLRLDFGAEANTLDFTDGEISLQSAKKGTVYAISSSAGKIRLGADSQATFTRNAETVRVSVGQGTADLQKTDGTVANLDVHHELEVNVENGESRIIRRAIAPLSPLNNAKLIYRKTGAAATKVDLAWEDENGEGASYTAEFSKTADFADIASSASGGGKGSTVELADGLWFWRVRDENGEFSPSRKFTLTGTDFTEAAYPPDNEQYQYRAVKPRIRFAWTEMPEAGSYLIEIAQSADFAKPAVRTRATGSSTFIQSLGEGTWFWRVTPVYAGTLIGPGTQAASRTIRIAKSGAMQPVETTTPFNNALYQVQELGAKGLAFSWIPDPEAVAYRLAVSSSKNLSNPVFEKKTDAPYLRVAESDCPALGKAGTYYWGVQWIDAEGNASPVKASRTLRGVDGRIAIRLSFPPEGYRIADSLARETRFTWKSNIAAKTVFQIAGDKTFDSVVFQSPVTAETISGKNWPAGTYYWRLRTYNTDDTVFLDTETRSFTIAEPFPAPVMTAPSQQLYILKGDISKIEWNPIPLADYYQISLKDNDSKTDAPVFSKNFITKTSMDFPFGELESGRYTMSIQAYAAASPMSTKIIGLIGDNAFTLKRVSPVVLNSPENRSSQPGLPARRGLLPFKYTLDETPDDASLIIASDAGLSNVLYKIPVRTGESTVRRLDPGTYYWTVRGTLAGIDISSKSVSVFTVSAIPPFPAPIQTSPAKTSVIGPQEIRRDKKIVFSWEPVQNAGEYELAIYQRGSKDPVLSLEGLTDTKYELNDLSVLDRGTFTWTATAISKDKTGEIEQPGIPAESSFTVDLPVLQKTKTSGIKNLYGK